MPLYVPDPENLAPAADLIEELGAELAARYAGAEDELIREVAKRSYRDLALQQKLATATLTAEQTKALTDRIAQNRAFAELAAYRAQSIRELQFLAVEVTEKLRRAGLAQELIDIAAKEGEAAAAARLRMASRLPSTSALTGNATQAVAALTIDLGSRLEAMHLRIARYPQDAYQRVISFTASSQMLTGQTMKVAQAQAVQRFLSQGITGFVDKADRHWRIGSYAEMAGRTAVRRAYEDAGTWRMQQSDINLVTIVGGIDACKKCAPWIGKILSTNGQTGVVELPHATEDRMVLVTIVATLDAAKAAGWGHPNCRDRTVAYLPGLTIPQESVEYSPEREKERAKQRELERGIRAAKRDAATAGDDVSRRRALREVRERQAGMREFINDTGRNRSNYREQLHFADGKGGMPRPNGVPRPPTPPNAPVRAIAPRGGIDIQIAKGTPLGDDVRAARASIARVHTIPNTMPTLPVTTLSPTAKEYGHYAYSPRTGDGVLKVRANGPAVQLTTAHEIGHYLDHRMFGTTSKMGTETLTSDAMKEWLRVAQASPQVRALQEMLGQATGPLEAHLVYLLSPAEMWGRSYGQYIGHRTGNPAIVAGVDHWLNSAKLWQSQRQWSTTDFDPIATAIDGVFREKGVLK